MAEDLALELARLQRLALAAVAARMAVEQVGEAFRALAHEAARGPRLAACFEIRQRPFDRA